MKPLFRLIYILIFAVPLSYYFYHIKAHGEPPPAVKSVVSTTLNSAVSQLNIVKNNAPAVQKTASPASSTIYKCQDNNRKITYSDQPCPGEGAALKELPVINSQPGRPTPPPMMEDQETGFSRAAMEDEALSGDFHCDGRTHCSQMTSCAEAMFFLKNCPGVQMDGGGDGVPCERQWCGR